MPGVVGSIMESLRYVAPLDSVEPAIPNTATPFAPLPQVMGMPGMVGSIVESLRYITPFAIDVMLFVIIKQLASPKKKLKVRALCALDAASVPWMPLDRRGGGGALAFGLSCSASNPATRSLLSLPAACSSWSHPGGVVSNNCLPAFPRFAAG